MPTFTIRGVVATVSVVLVSCAAPAPEVAKPAPAPEAATPRPKGIQTADLDRSVDPCVDFFAFGNGSWRAQNPIPAGMPKWSRRFAAHEGNTLRLQGLLAEISARTDWPAGSVEKLVGDHYASCMDEAKIDAAGLAPLSPLLTEIHAARAPADVQRIIRRLHELAISAPFGASGSMDYHEPTSFIENIVAGGLGLPDRDGYLKADPAAADVRSKYKAHVATVLELGGMPPAKAREAADGIIALEKRLAEASLDAATAADPAKTDHKMTFTQLEQLAPHVDWDGYFDEARLPRTDLNVAEPKFMAQLDKELAATPVATWKVYLEWQLLDSASPWLSRPFAQESFHFRDQVLGGSKATEMKPRAQRCADSTDTLFGEALGKKYVEKYFSPAARAKLQEIAANLLAALKDEVASIDWMGPAAKKVALERVATMDVEIGYPDQLRDYSAVTAHRDGFWANVAAGRKLGVDYDRSQVGKPTIRALWLLSPSSADAYIDFQRNQMVLPAGFLQSPSFDLEASDAVNYGAVGAALAHDLTHQIDRLGAPTDGQGRPIRWWSDDDLKQFEKRAQCLSDQFDGYFIEPGVHHQGKVVMGEAVADLAGVRLAYRALEKSMAGRPVPVIDGFTPEQQFFIAFEQLVGGDMRIEAQRQLVTGDPHPVPRFRVVSAVTNTAEFQQAFSCKADAPMVKPADQRCTVW